MYAVVGGTCTSHRPSRSRPTPSAPASIAASSPDSLTLCRRPSGRRFFPREASLFEVNEEISRIRSPRSVFERGGRYLGSAQIAPKSPFTAKCDLLLPQNLVQPLDNLGDIGRRYVGQALADPFYRQGSNLADLRPRGFAKLRHFDLQRQWKPGLLRLARQCNGNDRTGSGIEDIVAKNEHRTVTGLLMAPDWIEIGPADLTS